LIKVLIRTKRQDTKMEGANENLLNGGATPQSNKTDDEKSLAIVNLQAMLNIEDIGKVIELLEQNGFDES
jgi:hypothetical protein